VPLDVDVVIEGDAVAVARAAADGADARLKKATRFGTATVSSGDCSIDLVTSRAESYRRPGALPTVRPSLLGDDLRRRDFSINALAVSLNGPNRGEVADPAGGLDDLKAGLIRVLHDRSFQDDPTRILRAARYEQRFGFSIEPETLGMIKRDLDALSTVSGSRLRRELERTLREVRPDLALLKMDGLGILRAIQPGLSFGPVQAVAMECLGFTAEDSLAARWVVLCWNVEAAEIAAICSRLALTRDQRVAVGALPALRNAAKKLARDCKPSEVVGTLSDLPLAAVVALACISGVDAVRRQALDYIERMRHVRALLRGDDLIALGVPNGPRMGQATARLREARLDGQVKTRDDEAALVHAMMAEWSVARAG
jgi:tRNA nucleotidyltransferase (CCA-adding enzyme)